MLEHFASPEHTSPITVGVLIPAYNRQADVLRALASVLSQTHQVRRIVIVDDGSDPPLTLPPDAAVDARVSVIRLSENAGAAAARQAGLDALDTTHVAFLDADDTWMPDKLERQIAYLKTLTRSEQAAVACGWTWVKGDGTPLFDRMPRASRSLADFCSGCWYSPGSTVLAPKALLVSVGGYDTSLRRLEDLDLFIRIALNGGELAVAPFVGALIRKAQNGRRRDVDRATAHLRKKYLFPASSIMKAGLDHRLESWLAVEEAAAAFNEGHFGRCALRLMRSLALVPRTRVQLSDWWGV